MPTIEVDDETYDRLTFTARLVDEPVGAVVRRLLDRLSAEPAARAQPAQPAQAPSPPRPSPPAAAASPGIAAAGGATEPPAMDGWIAIHKIFKGHRVEGYFHPSTHEVRLKTEPWANKYFASPTAAAVKVVDHFAGDARQTPSTNGRKFWKVTATGEDLRSVIGQR